MKQPVVIALMVLVAFSLGCGKSEKTYKTPDGEVKVKQKSGEVTYEATRQGWGKVDGGGRRQGDCAACRFPEGRADHQGRDG